ncbi:MAG: hypothetical protein RR559_10855 [Bacteroides sp.]
MKLITEEEALHKVAAYCSAAEHCKAEVSDKLLKWGVDSAEILKSVLLQETVDKNKTYHKATRKLRIKLYGKILKSRALTSALTRKWIMQSGMAHIPLSQEVEPAVTPDGLIKEH